MKQARMIGNTVRNKASNKGYTASELGASIDCSEDLIQLFFDGRALLSFDKLEQISNILDMPLEAIIEGNEDEYDMTIVHCMNQFSNSDNRELILDLIDGYLDVKESLSNNS